MKEKIRILPVTKRKTLIRVNTAKPRPEIKESVAVPPAKSQQLTPVKDWGSKIYFLENLYSKYSVGNNFHYEFLLLPEMSQQPRKRQRENVQPGERPLPAAPSLLYSMHLWISCSCG